MALMSRFAKLDSAMQRGLDNGIALIFGGKVVPAEIEELLKQEAQDNLSATARGFVPNVYTVGVSSKDLENLSRDRQLPVSLADQLARFLRNEGMETFGPVIVRIAEAMSHECVVARFSSRSRIDTGWCTRTSASLSGDSSPCTSARWAEPLGASRNATSLNSPASVDSARSAIRSTRHSFWLR